MLALAFWILHCTVAQLPPAPLEAPRPAWRHLTANERWQRLYHRGTGVRR